MKTITVETKVAISQTRFYDIEVSDDFPDILTDKQELDLLNRFWDEGIEEYSVEDDYRDEEYITHFKSDRKGNTQ